MLDLMSLAASMGLQTEMPSVRKESDDAVTFQEQPVEQESTMLSAGAEAVEQALQTVENAASTVVSSLLPSWSAVSTTLDACTVEAPSVDLSLPAKAAK